MLLPRLQGLIDSGALSADPAQWAAAERLSELQARILAQPHRRRWLSWQREKPVNQGVYLWGEVGRGKSLLMNLFYETLPIEEKRRVHFHPFVLEAHSSLNAWRSSSNKRIEPLPSLAADLSKSTNVLCLDEFHVSDIVTAMILQGLLTALLDAGLYIITTSNFAPTELYKDGLQREKFLPCIDLLQQRLDIISLHSDKDYRTRHGLNDARYLSPLNPANQHALRGWFAELCQNIAPEITHINVQGREIRINEACDTTAYLHFRDVCGLPLGSGDYIALATRFKTIVLEGIPLFTDKNPDEAKRFMLFIDALYEAKTELFCTAAASPERLYREGFLDFEFQRTASRLKELSHPRGLPYAHKS
ncbi:MAG: cell division protein ZapE [Holosporales bacterium]|jgi:cell division protein ZapE